MIVYVYAKNTQQNMYSLPAKIAIERKVYLPNNNLEGFEAVQLSSQPNSNQALTTVDGFPAAYGYLFSLKSLNNSEKLEIIRSRVTKLCEFLNSYVLNKTPDNKLDSSYPIKPGATISKYSIATEPNITYSPNMRKLGDIIMVNDIQQVLNNMFDVKDKLKHHLFTLFFNHPCK